MTLIAAFRCYEGVVICADSQETRGDLRAPVKKIIHKDSGAYQVAIGGSGDDGTLTDIFIQRFIEEVGMWESELEEKTLEHNIRTSLSDFLYQEANVPQGIDLGIDFIVCLRRITDGRIFLWKLWGPNERHGPLIQRVEQWTFAGDGYVHIGEVNKLYQGNASAFRCILLGVHLLSLVALTSNLVGGETQVVCVSDTIKRAWYQQLYHTMYEEEPERIRKLQEHIRTFNQRTANLLLDCLDTTIYDAAFEPRLAEYTKEMMQLREEYIVDAIYWAEKQSSVLGVEPPYFDVPATIPTRLHEAARRRLDEEASRSNSQKSEAQQ